MKKYVFIDFETTGLNPEKDYPTEVAVKVLSLIKGVLKPTEYSTKIKLPEGIEVPKFITELTGLTTEEVNTKGANMDDVKSLLLQLIDDYTVVVAHNANFDLGFLFHHFGIEPKYFICTRTISILTEPHESASLKDVYARMYGEKEQTHRAGDDTDMLVKVFDGFAGIHGADDLGFFCNKIVNMPDRGMVYTPDNAKVLDFTAKYHSARQYEKLEEKYSRAEDLLGEAHDLLDDVYCHNTDIYEHINDYFEGK